VIKSQKGNGKVQHLLQLFLQ